MEKYENTQTNKTTNEIIVHELTDKDSSSTFVKEYLKAGFVSSAVDQLFYARRQAGLTQAQVAEQMNTKQAAIARLEADTDGSMSLRRYAEFALSCGMVPLEITLVPIESARYFVIANPDSSLTQKNYDTWLLTKDTLVIPASQNVQATRMSAPQNWQATVVPAPQNVQATVFVGQATNTMPQTIKTSSQNIVDYGNPSQERRPAA